MDTILYSRSSTIRAIGCLYLAIGGPAAIVVSVMAFGSMFAMAEWLGFRADSGLLLSIVAAFLIVALGAMYVLLRRHYHRVGYVEVRVYPDQITILRGNRQTLVPLAFVRELRVRDAATGRVCLLLLDGGATVRLPSEVATFEMVGPTLMPVLTPYLEQRLKHSVDSGEMIDARDDVALSYGRVTGGLLILIAMPLLFVLSKTTALKLLAYAHHVLRQGLRGRRGGFLIGPHGLIPPDDSRVPVPWDRLTLLARDDDGIVLSAHSDYILSASCNARDYVRASCWVATKLAAASSMAISDPNAS